MDSSNNVGLSDLNSNQYCIKESPCHSWIRIRSGGKSSNSVLLTWYSTLSSWTKAGKLLRYLNRYILLDIIIKTLKTSEHLNDFYRCHNCILRERHHLGIRPRNMERASAATWVFLQRVPSIRACLPRASPGSDTRCSCPPSTRLPSCTGPHCGSRVGASSARWPALCSLRSKSRRKVISIQPHFI